MATIDEEEVIELEEMIDHARGELDRYKTENAKLKASLTKYKRYAQAEQEVDEKTLAHERYPYPAHVRRIDVDEVRRLRTVAMQDL